MPPTPLDPDQDPVTRYLELGLALGRHVDGLVDAYTGPADLAVAAAQGSMIPATRLAEAARRLLADLETGDEPEPGRRRWMAAQVRGLRTTAARLAGEPVSYADEVEACYGVRPRMVSEDIMAEAQRRLETVLPGAGQLRSRYGTWREAQAVPPEHLEAAIASLLDDLRERTHRSFGLPEGEHVDIELVTDQPWSGFNYYLGGLRSRVAVNVDLPVLSPGLAHLVAHEAYPGHHTEHCRKERDLVERDRHLEHTIFLVNTPECLMAEGLADLGVPASVGDGWGRWAQEILADLGLRVDGELAERMADATAGLDRVRQDAALMLHDRGASADEVAVFLQHWLLVPEERARQMLRFLSHPLWRAYTSTYVEGYRLLSTWLAARPASQSVADRFVRLLDEPLIPAAIRAELAA